MCFDRLPVYISSCTRNDIIIIFATLRRCHRNTVYDVRTYYYIKYKYYIICLVTPTGVRAGGRNGLSSRGVRVCAGGLATRAPLPRRPPPPPQNSCPRRRDPPRPPRIASRSCGKCKHVPSQSLLHTRCQTHTATT